MFTMVYHVVITDNQDRLLADAKIVSDSLINAGIIAEKIYEHYNKKTRSNITGQIKVMETKERG